MLIKYLGWQSFIIRSRDGVIITQPFSSQLGRRFPKVKPDVVLSKGPLTSAPLAGRPLFFFGPGDYEVKGMEIWGIPGGFWILSEGRKILWLFSDRLAKNSQPLPVMRPDVLLLGAKNPDKGWVERNKQLLDKLSPAVIIPFARENLSPKEMASADWARPILDLLDMEKLPPQANFSLKLGEELAEERRLILLSPRSL